MKHFLCQLIPILNILLFTLVGLSFHLGSILVYLICVLGLTLNLYCTFKKQVNSLKIEKIANEPNLSEKDMIMEDLDREANRRRQVQQLNKN